MKIPKLNFAHLCDSAFLSQEGKLNVIGIFKVINTAKLPIIHPKMTCVVNLTISEKSILKIQILKTETREVLSKIETKLDSKNKEGAFVEVGFINDFNNVKFEEAGEHYFEIWLNDEIVDAIPFTVNLISKK